jgi:methionyl aminopeptidase
MTIKDDADLTRLKAIGGIVARTLAAMGQSLEPGMSTRELDDIGRRLLEREGARPAPEMLYDFPGATCISISPAIAHGVPGDQTLAAGDLVNIDVSAERDGLFADTGASFAVQPVSPTIRRLCRDGKRAMWAGIGAVRAGAPLRMIGERIQSFAEENQYTLIRNLASHGIGEALHEEPREIATWLDRSERRIIANGAIFTVEPFLSVGANWAVDDHDDGWTLMPDMDVPCVQYEHTLVATKRGSIVVTIP